MTATRSVPPPPRDTTHTTALADTHSLASHAVPPTRPPPEYESGRSPECTVMVRGAPEAGGALWRVRVEGDVVS